MRFIDFLRINLDGRLSKHRKTNFLMDDVFSARAPVCSGVGLQRAGPTRDGSFSAVWKPSPCFL